MYTHLSALCDSFFSLGMLDKNVMIDCTFIFVLDCTLTFLLKTLAYHVWKVLGEKKMIMYSIQFNSKTLFKDGDPVSLQLIFPVAIQTCEQYNKCSYMYTKQNKFIGQTQANTTYTFIQNISITTHT